jgi:23S rRNA (uracil1939-C5)-methyltransferase
VSRHRRPEGDFELGVDDLADDGRGVGRIDGKAVFVDGALAGERVRFRYRRRRSRFDEGELREVLSPAPDRVVPGCPHFGVCGGCSLQHLEASRQILAKQSWLVESLQRLGGVVPETLLAPVAGPLWHYRRRARLGVKDVPGKGRVLVGFRERRAPYVADMRVCKVLDSRADQLLEPLSELLGRLTLRRRIPQIDVAIGDHQLALAIRVLDPPTSADLKQLREFARAHAVQLYLQPGGERTLAPLEPAAPAPLSYRLPSWNLELEFLPGHFVQVNTAINQKLLAMALELLAPRPDSRVLDLFCGLGNFSLPLALHAGEVVGIEGDADLVSWATRNARRNGITNARFQLSDLSRPAALEALTSTRFDRVLLDPPRSGAAQALEMIARVEPQRVVYVSCHPGTLARDAGRLVAELGFHLHSAGVLDMFPHTTHVESIALFVRKDTTP